MTKYSFCSKIVRYSKFEIIKRNKIEREFIKYKNSALLEFDKNYIFPCVNACIGY